jgi:AcrR family transcriptional regulator
MRLSAKDRRQQLIRVAMRLFAAQGFDATTTREIAEAAQVNEAIIFRHFASKEELYWAVVNDRVGESGRRRKIRECLTSDGAPREILARVAGVLLDRDEEDSTLTRLLWFSTLRNADLSASFFRNYISENFELLAEYFRNGIKAGRFRNIDPMIAARGFLGALVHHYLVQELFQGSRYQQFDPYQLGQQIADIWLNGISASVAIETSARPVHRSRGSMAGSVAAATESGGRF